MEFFGDYVFNTCMDFFAITVGRQRLFATLLLAAFVLNVTTASLCCDTMSGAAAMEMTASEAMPCHGDGAAEQSGDCCLSCVAMVLSVQMPTDSTIQQADATSPRQLELLTRPDRLYRPPIHHLS